MSTGAIVGAALRRAERRLIEHLRTAGAVDPASASPIPPQSWMGYRALRRLLAVGAVLKAEPNYYLDESRYSDYTALRKRRMMIIMPAVALAALLLMWWGLHR